MGIFRESKAMERLLAIVTLLTLISFAYYFTLSDVEELQGRYNSKRVLLVKLLSQEITGYLEKRIELTPRLTNFLAEESVAYAVVQQGDGYILAKAENYAIPLGILDKIEEMALKATHLTTVPYKDPSRTVALSEVILPIMTYDGKKIILRVGFFKNHEIQKIVNIKFRNSLIFSFLIFAIAIVWFLRKHKASNLQNSLMGTSAIIILMLFFSARLTIQNWYDAEWHQNFTKHVISISKMFSSSAQRYIETSIDTDLLQEYKTISQDSSFAYLAIIKDEKIIYHSDPTQVDTIIENDTNYVRSLNSSKPILARNDELELYEVYVPILKGQQRLGSIKVGWHKEARYEALAVIKDRMILVFLAAIVILLLVNHLLSRRVTKEIQWFIKAMEQVTSGDLRQAIYIDRNDEFGQLAHAFNFMLMSLKEKEMIGRGLQQYVSRSIVEKTLKAIAGHEKNGEKSFAVVLFVYFSGINEAIAQVDGSRIFSGVQECVEIVNRAIVASGNINMQVMPSGIITIFTISNRHDSLLKALNTAVLLAKDFGHKTDLPFAPKVTLHSMDVVRGAVLENKETMSFIGDGFADFRTMAKIQGNDEIIVTREVKVLLQDVVSFDELEVLSSVHGRISVYLFKHYKETSEIKHSFEKASGWTKIMILRILKSTVEQLDPKTMFSWFEDEEPEVRYYVMEIVERVPASEAIEFVERVVETEKDLKVLSRAISILGKIGAEKHIPLLSEKLRSTDRRVKANAVEALELIGGKRVYEFFNLLVDEEDNRVKANILIALGKYGDLKVFDLLNKMIMDTDPNMRASAAYALGQLGMIQGVEPLINALSDKDLMVRRQVVASLTALKADIELEM
jgi:HAMP domain-containing protein